MDLPQMCLQGSAMVLVVLAVRAIGLKRLPKATFLVLWAVVLARLLVPFSLPAPLDVNVWSLAQEGLASLGVEVGPATAVAPAEPSGTAADAQASDTATVHAAPAPDAAPSAQTGSDGAAADEGAGAPLRPATPWTWVWVAGSLAFAAFVAVSYAHHGRRFSYAVPVAHPSARRWLAAHRLRRPLRLKESPLVSSPITYGVLRPTIVVPVEFDWDDPSKSALVLEHEFVHVARFDAVFKALLLAVAGLYWFDPLVWALYLVANRDIELSCDERVARRLNRRGRSLYAHALIDAAEHHAGRGVLAPIGFGKNAIEERVVALGAVRPHTAFTALATTALAGCLLLGLATTAPLAGLVGDALRPTAATVVDAAAPQSDDGLVAVYAIGGATRLMTPYYAVDVPDGAVAGEPVWSFSTGHADPAPSEASDVLIVRDGSTGNVALVAYLMAGRVYEEDVAAVGAMPGYTRAAHGSVSTAAGEHGLVVAVPEGSTLDAGQTAASAGGVSNLVYGLDGSAAPALLAAPDGTAAVLVSAADRGSYPAAATVEDDGLHIATSSFDLVIPTEYATDGLRVTHRTGTFAGTDTVYSELQVVLPDGRVFHITCTDASHTPGRGPQTVLVPIEGAPAGMQVYVGVTLAAGCSAEDAALFAGWVTCRG